MAEAAAGAVVAVVAGVVAEALASSLPQCAAATGARAGAGRSARIDRQFTRKRLKRDARGRELSRIAKCGGFSAALSFCLEVMNCLEIMNARRDAPARDHSARL